MNAYALAATVYGTLVAECARRGGAASDVPALPDQAPANLAALLDRAQALALATSVVAPTGIPQLTSIFGHLYQATHDHYYAPSPVGSDAAKLIPTPNVVSGLSAHYQQVWTALAPAWSKAIHATANPAVREANLHALLQRDTWSMAAPLTTQSQGNQTDINFYDYARVTAALAVCLDGVALDATEPALLVGGDISGVQEWLYTFGSAGAAKSLRGRSFYLQLLSEVIALYVLRELELPQANLLYAGGGGFYLLAPVSKADQIKAIHKTVSAKLLTMHEGAIYVALASTPLTVDHLLGTNDRKVGDAWGDLSGLLGQQKTRRFSELDDGAMAAVIGAPLAGSGLPEETCRVCRRAMIPGEDAEWTEDPTINPNAGKKCALCKSFEDLGKDLRDAEFLVISHIPPTLNERVISWQQGVEQLGFDIQLLPLADPHHRPKSWRDRQSKQVHIYYWERQPEITDFPGWPGDERTIWAFRPLAQCVPQSINAQGEREIADFSDLAQASDGIKRWGVLRMDVDNLGTIFRSALPANSLCGVVGVSGLLRLFFEGWVPRLARQLNLADKPRAYLMYAGGDDLFIVGSWSVLPGLAHAIRRDFGRFVCGNPQVTISGGISLALDEKYPLYQAAREAGHAEELAKDLPEKDGIAFLGQALKWGDEYSHVVERVDEILNWLGSDQRVQPTATPIVRPKPLPRSFLMNLRALDSEWREWKKRESGRKRKQGIAPRYAIHENKELYLGPWQWHLVYTLYRAAERTRDGSVINEVKALSQALIAGEIKTIGMTARWAELLMRQGGE